MGPTAKFHVTNIHTMAELKLSGNHLQGSRPCVSFDKMFDEQPHLQVSLLAEHAAFRFWEQLEVCGMCFAWLCVQMTVLGRS